MENVMSIRSTVLLLATVALLSTSAAAQDRTPGWELGADLIYQDAQSADFEGGSSIQTDTDYGLSFTLGYRFNPYLEVHFAIDWQDTNFKAELVSQTIPSTTLNVNSSLEAFTPRAAANFNFMDGPFTPFVTGGVGWTFVDTNVPNGLPQNYCWFDPWWGTVCAQNQPSESVDALVYNLGIGGRWDFTTNYSLRFAYERHWVDYENATSTPDFDQIKAGFSLRF
jgi:opacity protein-like surface antigen